MGIHKPTAPSSTFAGYPDNVVENNSATLYKSNVFYPCLEGRATPQSANVNASANYLRVVPFVTRAAFSIDALCVFNTDTGQSGTKARFGIYGVSATSAIDNLIAETGELTLDSSMALRAVSITETALTGGTLYFLAMVSNGNFSCAKASSAGGNRDGNFGDWLQMSGLASNSYPAFYKAHTYGALPDPFGTIVGGADGARLGVLAV